ncbi:Ubiquitin-associated/translation elongation factor EF1B, N-terminal, eukaryote [Penicillium griseofulvum]|uniref:Ubiquitin-associated/translation elongation factor EF1B, N-terminal, eukaryote n=1 Tax=Penicillium patulum TaxID=5078 RepID=A0A135LMB1_PENPA|nr:Ubiquitin-associated/translation elongation factor EF1B, N-terminal, eukaryote [Penicillium griseofulvum]KXG50111.1 Ubiquitin-associated/translation elongation factor EF1B, N-terminal, eukaryote [Penicillium griseofulvum]
MEDLNGLSWSSDSKNPSKPPPMSSGYLYPSIPSNGGSGRSTPLSATSNRSSSPSKPATSSGDSFANLVSFNSSAGNKNVSLLEQQKRLQEEKAKKEADKRSQFESQYGGQNNQFWDNFEGRTQSPASIPASRSVPPPADDEDILAAFDAAAPVDASTHFPVPESLRSSPRIDVNNRPGPSNGGITMQDNTGDMSAFDDDDPFGLNQLKPKSAPAPPPQQGDDDDFLGLLGKPVSEIPHQEPPPKSATPSDRGRDDDASPMPSNEVDRAIAELVDMGFPADKSRRALDTTESGTDVQAAVGWLLTQAHAESRQKTEGHSSGTRSADRAERSDSRNRDRPSWMREDMPESRSRQDRRSPASADKDPAQVASQFGNNLLKSAGSLWKTGSKKFQQAVSEFNAENDPSQPRWMRDASAAQDEPPLQPQRPGGRDQPALSQREQQELTNEALLLESGGGRPQKPPRSRETHQPDPRSQPSRDQPAPGAVQPRQQPNFLQRPSRPTSQDPKSRLSRFAAEEQQAQAYVSPARRKRPQAPPPPSEPAVDLFDSPAPSASRSKPPTPAQSGTPPARSASIPVRPKAPTRSIPPVSQEALQSTHRHRTKAAESYKRGDYAEAHQSFSTALGMLPDKHPITIIIRSNRAMTALKIGEPKSAIDDADIILTFIGPSRGESEAIDLCTGEPPKPMKDFFGKALMRKAEALEQLERWGDAAQAWKLAVESGHGGSTSIQGRNRCEKAAGINKPQSKPAAAPVKKRPSPPPKKAPATSGLTATSASGTDFEAVSRLRQANQAAERADEEKFALSESVDARIAAWRNGKQDNLRALLGSLDSVLWPEAGWKKIGLSELVLPNKVKIQYMKGISKVHPDKIPTTATTEQRMIAGSVFGTLNEAWDKFRAENNL